MPAVPLPPEPVVSIIIPCYNARETIAEAIESALAQTWPRKEIIVIDDGSTDGSLEVIRSFGDRIRWHTQPNAGGSAARNQGLALARGECIQFLDSDDLLLPQCVEHKVAWLRAAPAGEIPCCQIETLILDGHTADLGFPDFWKNDFFDLRHLMRHGAPQTSTPLHRAEHLRAIGGGRPGLTSGQEFDLHLRLILHLGVVFRVHAPAGVVIRARSGSVSRSSVVRVFSNKAFIIGEAIKVLASENRLDSAVRADAAAKMGVCARRCWVNGDPERGNEIAAAAKALDPAWTRAIYPKFRGQFLVGLLGFDRYERLKARRSQGSKSTPSSSQ